jgi:hypothetical protein
MYYKQPIISLSAFCLATLISMSSSLSGCDSPGTSSKNYVSLNVFVGVDLPKTDFTIWVPIHHGSHYARNTARHLAFQDASMRNKSSRISEDLFIRIKAYQGLLIEDHKALSTKLTELNRHPADRAAVFRRNNDRLQCIALIDAYKRAITLLEEVKRPDPSRPACISPLVRDFSPWG